MFKEEYQAAFSKVTASAETYRRIMNMTSKKKRSVTGVLSKVLIAAVLMSLLVMTVAAAAESWFVSFFAKESDQPLSQEQVAFIEENEMMYDMAETQKGWSIKLHSAITDGMKGYIMLCITAPEDIDLSDLPLEAKSNYYGPGNDFLPKSSNTALSCTAYPDIYGVLGNIGTTWQEDGDGRNNTLNYVIDVAPDIEWAETDPFGKDVKWNVHFENLVSGFPTQTVLAEGIWDFEFSFEHHIEEIELLTVPLKTEAWAYPADGSAVQAEVTLTSLVIRPFGIAVYYGDESDGLDYSRTSIRFTSNETGKTPWFVVMKDGSKVELRYGNSNPIERYVYLETALPLTFDHIDCILLADGTLIPMVN